MTDDLPTPRAPTASGSSSLADKDRSGVLGSAAMPHGKTLALIAAVVTSTIVVTSVPRATGSTSPPGQWPQWRGPLATGEAPDGNPPAEWSETRNIKWKVP